MENEPICTTDINGTKKWQLDGRYHREDGPAIEHTNGQYGWYLNGKLHREDGPAAKDAYGTKYWYKNGRPHRLDGPAIEHYNGTKYWYVNDCNVTDLITKWSKENDIDLNNLTEMDKALIKLTWADYGK